MSFQVSQQWTLGPRWQQLPGLRPPWVLYNCFFFFLTLLATNHAFHNLQFSCTSCLPESIQTERTTSAAIFCIIRQCSSNISKRTENVILRGSGNLGFVLLSPYSLEKTSCSKKSRQSGISEYQLSSVTQSCPTLCNPMNCSMSGLPVHHQLQELSQTHVHWVGDVIQPPHPLSSPSPPTLNLSQHQGLIQWVSSLHQVAKVLVLQLHY